MRCAYEAVAGIALVFASATGVSAQTNSPGQTIPPSAVGPGHYGNPQHAYGPKATVGDTVEAVREGAHLQDLYGVGNPHVTRQLTTLSPAQCQQRIAAAPARLRSQAQALDCTRVHYHFHAARLPLPAGINPQQSAGPLFRETARAALLAGWWYWTDSNMECDLFCSGWGSTDWADGVDNGASVWDWHQQCTAFGIAQQVTRFTNFNGGPPPYYGLQLVDDFKVCLGTGWVSFCASHGMRQWIDWYGDPTTYYDY